MPIVTKRSQLPVGYNFIVHECDTSETNCNSSPMEMVLSLKFLGVIIGFGFKLFQ